MKTDSKTSTRATIARSLLVLAMARLSAAGNIDFSDFAAGDFVNRVSKGVTVQVTPLPNSGGGCFAGDAEGTFGFPMIFDSSQPTGGDNDLGTPNNDFGGPGRGNGGAQGQPGENSVAQGNLLIISEDCNQEEPDDSLFGGVFTFTFDKPAPLKSIGLLDFEGGASISAKLHDGSTFESGELPNLRNNGFLDFHLDLYDVVELTVTFQSSGAIANIKYKAVDPIGAYGDPHFKTWNSTIYSFHGMCDMVLMDTPGFGDGLGLAIHLRTRIVGALSVIRNVVLAIGRSRFEVVMGDEAEGTLTYDNGSPGLPASIAGFPIVTRTKQVAGGRLHVFTIELGGKDKIVIKSFPRWVDIRIKSLHNRHTKFAGSLGMLGALDGRLLGRDQSTVVDDPNDLAHEWQVRTSTTLFHDVDGPQYPDACVMPPSQQRRALRGVVETSLTEEDAKEACSHAADSSDYEACLSDVMSTGSLEFASHYE